MKYTGKYIIHSSSHRSEWRLVMKDNKDKREAQKSTLGKVLKRIKKYSGFLVISILMAAVTVASTLYVPILVGRGIDHIIGPGNVDFAGITKVLITIGIVVAITALSQWIMNICNNRDNLPRYKRYKR